ncbi:sulfate/molybdate ABC transporter ATP-binding protein [Paenibacillus mucilaginosus]|uniref:Carnitine transport ATP-binding protein OpuCA n=1 Tax=Paenibacillus mucilaginosus (strain KNP414) TaxID=1036673 RepID=F8F8N3_PAEMK|nr:sulfate ABC transporter ATP-binding protein [Paenibacillus mucilaginosus]AEI41621.1 sulfate ABC transporter, ATPase subunit [Paenibacillus mucilaginosus KNP414]MCG7214323.1 sulfate ABC transporter ATP-binding protein [Paenibacillus mucilaginosus]WDM30611.1 sulfate ABC transporter ATP-binding protein [Paenibacillus mucilaginosus]
MHIEARHLTKSFGSFRATDNVSFGIEKGKLIGLLGPSGGGKTTILRMLAGLEEPDSGDILFHGQRVNDLAPQARGIGFVFQNYALFRHMTVFDNIAFGLTVQKKSKAQIKARVEELIELTGLKGLTGRLPHQLSGGQRQRVAFARAIAPEPQLLLLDEPFAAIDAKVRKELRTWLKEMIDRVGITTIFVTHDQEEAVEVADQIMIINHGRLEQQGTPIEIYKKPRTPFVAGFIGESNQLGDISNLKGFEADLLPNARAIIRPEFIEIGRPGEVSYPSAAEQGTVKQVYFRGINWQVEVEVEGDRLFAYRSPELPELMIGEQVQVLIHRVYLFNEQDQLTQENGLKGDPMPVHI